MKVYCFSNLLLLFFSLCLSAQTTRPTYKQTGLGKILQNIEQSTGLTFNYDPTALDNYQFSGQLNNGTIQAQLKQLFYNTPYTFEITPQSILVYSEPSKAYRVCGTIKDKESATTLPLANIFLDDQKQGTQSDENGFFDIEINAQKHQISVAVISGRS